MTVPLLVGLDGVEKMSKSLGNAIAVEDSATEIYGRTMSIPDTLMWDWLLLLTDTPESEIAERKREVAAGNLHPKKVKQALARDLVAQFHGAQAAADAEAEFERVFAGGGVPDEIPELVRTGSEELLVLLREAGVVASGNEARRLLKQGAISLDGDVLGEDAAKLRLEPREAGYLAKVGKRRFVTLRIL